MPASRRHSWAKVGRVQPSWLGLDLRGEEGDPEVFGFLDDRVERSRFAYLVDMDHFINEEYDFRLLVLRYLASRGRTIVGEELLADRAARNSYLSTGAEVLLRRL
jgi:hypothetical protein